MDSYVMKQTRDGSFFVSFAKGSEMWRKAFSPRPICFGEYVHVLQVAYSDGIYTIECIPRKERDK